ncbi:GL24991 [Drosophila persimilis]|uniref:GL24991 n=1 Tax=Drosophila persimilis TaxID=7234 RepID=B4GR99_DROPE|nr:GL24991 [Drosophila persimilis]
MSKEVMCLLTNNKQPLNAARFDDEFIYADLESQHYGPINYKAASLYAQVKKNKKTGALEELK